MLSSCRSEAPLGRRPSESTRIRLSRWRSLESHYPESYRQLTRKSTPRRSHRIDPSRLPQGTPDDLKLPAGMCEPYRRRPSLVRLRRMFVDCVHRIAYKPRGTKMKRPIVAVGAIALLVGFSLTAADAQAQRRGGRGYRPAVTMPHRVVNRPSVTMPHSVAGRHWNHRPITRPVNRHPYARPSVSMPHSTVNRPSVTMPHHVAGRPMQRPRPGYGTPKPRHRYDLQRGPGFTTRRYIGRHGNWRKK